MNLNFKEEFSNKAVLVTGASRGIGKAIASLFASCGAIVVGSATTENGANDISDYLSNYDNKGHGLILNLGDKDSINAGLDKFKELTGKNGPDILINNAGIVADNIILRMTDVQWDDVININLNGLFYLTKGCLKNMMKSRFGRVISISSVIGATGNVGQANYAAAKAGIAGFTKSLAKELGSRNITANVIAPGFIESEMTSKLTSLQRDAILKQLAITRLGTVEDVAGSAMFLASSFADYITGQTLHVNGGMYMN